MKNETEIIFGYIALGHEEEVAISEKRKEWQREAKIVPLKLRSVETDGFVIEPVEDIFLGKFEIRGVTPSPHARADMFMLDTQTGKIWTRNVVNDVQGSPHIWVPEERLDSEQAATDWMKRQTFTAKPVESK